MEMRRVTFYTPCIAAVKGRQVAERLVQGHDTAVETELHVGEVAREPMHNLGHQRDGNDYL